MKKRCLVYVAGIISSAIVLGGCGGSSDSYSYDASESYASNAYAEEAMAAEEYYDGDVYSYSKNGGDVDDVAPSEEIADDNMLASSSRKLIKNVNLTVETREFDELIDTISSKIIALGGYAENTNINGNSYTYNSQRTAYIVARIPANNLDSFVTVIDANSNITNKSESADDVTLQYADVEAHRNSLRVEQERLNDLLAEADSLETIIALEQRLSEVRYELESYESRLRTMDNQVQYSTVYINVNEVKEYEIEPVEEPTFAERISEGFLASCITAWETIQDFIVGFVSFLPVLVVLLIILAIIGLFIFIIIKIVAWIVGKMSAKNTAKKIQRAQAKAQKANKETPKVAVALEEKPDKVEE